MTGQHPPTFLLYTKQFLGLASYYRRYIPKFSTIAAPLTNLTHKGAVFSWSAECESSFQLLKSALTQAPILTYPNLSHNTSPFVLQTNASAFGLGAVLEQDNHVIAYPSCTLPKREWNYSVIQKECLAIVYILISSLFTWQKVSPPHRSCTPAMAEISKDERYAMLMGIVHTKV